ncbi:hypothetical protein ACFFGF_04745 [Asaia lannensis]|uniref:Uncharacterized protein n=1 Tax=Asaia lannensis NBRC 102526 TaxID=1307926 RepID=A0ABT1CKD0_9PROT|nr:hypothetical protein [Asaia lannensis]MCO6160678.1 hypothetical protein [Asaia lannensis NBRC 102526]GBR01993.1 hypothetical protein AA102526_2682 [Asaia lannensis NBRC 102526]
MAGEIDTSIALQAGRPSINMLNPLEVARQGAEYRNALLGNKIRQSEYDARVAQGNALLGATGADGQVDYAKARAAMARDPAAAYGAVDAYRQQNASRNDDLQNAEASKNAVGSIMSFVGANPDAAHLDAGARMAKAVLPKSQWGQIDAIVHQIGSHPNGIAGGVAQITNSMQAPQGQEQNVYGTAGATVDNGQQTIIGTQGSAMTGGQFRPATTVQKETSPEFNSAPTEVINPDGSRSYVRRDQIVGTGGGRPTVPPEAMGSGRYPSQQAGNPGYQAAPAAGQTEAIAATAKAGAEGANALMQASANRNDRMAMLGNMASDLEGFTSGPGRERWRNIEATWNNWTPYSVHSGESEIEKAQSFNKWAQNLANAQSQALGTGTDSKLAAAVHASPNSSLQDSTNRLMIHQLQGNEDAINAKAQAWKSSGLQPAQFQQWNQQFSQSFDPRAFQMIRMTPAERTTYIEGLKKSGQFDELKKNYNAMAAAGLVPDGR